MLIPLSSMSLKSTILIITALFLIVNTSLGQKNGKYSATITEVEPISFGGSFTDSEFKDQSISILWTLSDKELFFDLTNNSDGTIKIIWDDAAYIDPTGQTNKVFHNGVKYTDRNSSLPSTSIIKGAKLTDIVAPSDYAYFLSGQYGGWMQKSLFPYSKKIGVIHDGKQFKVLLPLQIGVSRRDYIFTFKTKWQAPLPKK